MSSSEITKNSIITATKNLIKNRPIEKISTRDITNACGLNRNTFYYHFKDKYEILEWIFNHEVKPVLDPYMKLGDWPESAVTLCELMRLEPEFYGNALKSGQNRQGSFIGILETYFKEFFIQGGAAHYDRLGLSAENREMVARFYSHAVIGIICDWVSFGMKKDPRKMAEIIHLVQEQKLFL